MRASGFVLVGLMVTSPGMGAAAQLVGDSLVVTGPSLWGESPELVEELRIGTAMGSREESFGLIGGVLPLTDGSIWIGDRHLGAIQRFDSTGRYLGQVGRSGQGPGEFRYPQGMRQLSDGSVAVWDDGQVRISLFGSSGTFLRSFQPPSFMIGTPMEELELDRETGQLMLLGGEISPDPRGKHSLFWLRLSPDGVVLDTVFVEPREPEGLVDSRATLTALSPLGYRVLGRNDSYALTLELSPTRRRVLTRPSRPIPYQDEERREKERLARLFSERTGLPAGRIGRTKPVFSRIQVDETGRLWLTMYSDGFAVEESEGERSRRQESCRFFGVTSSECDQGIRRWTQDTVLEVMTPEGNLYGRIALPNRESELAAARGNLIWLIETGSLGEQYVVRYRIRAASSAGAS